jgi:hypothetical protein
MAGITRLSFIDEIVTGCPATETALTRLVYFITSSEYSGAGTMRSLSIISWYEHLTIFNIYTAWRGVLSHYYGFLTLRSDFARY